MISNRDKVEVKHFQSDAVKEAYMRKLVGPEEGWDSHVMREMELKEGGHSPYHEHPWPHINYMISGEGVLHMDGVDYPVSAGSFAYVPANTIHQFKNVGEGSFKFICIVPTEGHQ